MDQRSTIREMSVATGISIRTLSRHLKKETFRRRSTRIKPLLSEANKLERIQFCDVVHLDEKWFNTDKDRRTQDNTTPHRSITDAVLESVSTDGWTFVMRIETPNSPDLNMLDLGLFAFIQSLQLKKVSRTVDEVIRYTLAAFDELSYEKLESVFLTFQAIMRLVLEHAGDNNYALRHLKKAALRRAGLLMSNVSCPVSLLL
ncbi:hypothetical protein DYB36_013416 [Aphanomyces astaci]|uniref:Transposase Tc1-like domain-containing protein n=1 Tax=Aphanomyces astaci TaxID=112090 RepID=A0A397BRT3_APHAT|nr:hypothetical protein DYB36_013416 [Aphanomyces astaci]